MDYNTARGKLIMPEYGRNIQNMAALVTKIEDRDERNAAAQTLVDVMGNLYPYLRDIPDFKHKLWDHLAIMTDFKLDIDYPYELPTASILTSKPDRVPYNNTPLRFRHYGKMVEQMIKQACKFPEGEERDMLIRMIADHMKKAYLQWNKDSVSDQTIIEDFRIMSNGELLIPEGFQFADIKDLLGQTKTQNNRSQNQNQKKQGSNNNSSNNNQQRRNQSGHQQNQHRRY